MTFISSAVCLSIGNSPPFSNTFVLFKENFWQFLGFGIWHIFLLCVDLTWQLPREKLFVLWAPLATNHMMCLCPTLINWAALLTEKYGLVVAISESSGFICIISWIHKQYHNYVVLIFDWLVGTFQEHIILTFHWEILILVFDIFENF